jgi:hypothetical protein
MLLSHYDDIQGQSQYEITILAIDSEPARIYCLPPIIERWGIQPTVKLRRGCEKF